MHSQPSEGAWLAGSRRHRQESLAARLQAQPWLANRLADPEASAEELGAAGHGQLCSEIARCPRVNRHVRLVFGDHAED